MAKSIISMPTRQKRNKARSRARYELRRPLLKQVKAQAARIAELEAAIDALTLSGADCYALVLELEEREEKYRLCIAELEADRDHWRNLVNDLEHNSIYLDSIAYYEGRIAELEAAIALSR